MEGRMEELKIGWFGSLEDLEEEINYHDCEVLEINEECVVIAYEEDGDQIQECYELNVTYRNGRPSTITLGNMIHRERI